MPPPYSLQDQHRDFIVVIALCLLPLVFTMGYVRLLRVLNGPKRATIFVDGMCCELTATPAIHELTQVAGVLGITPNYQQKAIQLDLRSTRPTSPKSIWEAVEKSPLRPTRLVVGSRTFSTRPVD